MQKIYLCTFPTEPTELPSDAWMDWDLDKVQNCLDRALGISAPPTLPTRQRSPLGSSWVSCVPTAKPVELPCFFQNPLPHFLAMKHHDRLWRDCPASLTKPALILLLFGLPHLSTRGHHSPSCSPSRATPSGSLICLISKVFEISALPLPPSGPSHRHLPSALRAILKIVPSRVSLPCLAPRHPWKSRLPPAADGSPHSLSSACLPHLISESSSMTLGWAVFLAFLALGS